MLKHLSTFRLCFFGFFFLLGCCNFCSLFAEEYNIVPYPKVLKTEAGSFSFNKQTVIFCSSDQPEIFKLAQQFATQFELVSGIKLTVNNNISRATSANAFIFQPDTKIENTEAYRLSISPKSIRIQAKTPNGFFYALQTLYQLLPADIYGKRLAEGKKWKVRAAEISDEPRFAYRGLHLDVCRHFFSVEFIKKYIDAMAIHKMNTFHWHLTEDQGWRIEIKKYPKLTSIGSKRDETLIGRKALWWILHTSRSTRNSGLRQRTFYYSDPGNRITRTRTSSHFGLPFLILYTRFHRESCY